MVVCCVRAAHPLALCLAGPSLMACCATASVRGTSEHHISQGKQHMQDIAALQRQMMEATPTGPDVNAGRAAIRALVVIHHQER